MNHTLSSDLAQRPKSTHHASELPWWKRTTVYQVYPRSFADTNGDGIGDLRGVIGKLDYLRDLGVETIWLSPFFDSPQADFGYDIRDHFGISSEYGSLDDCHALIEEVHQRGMRVVFDMVLNHTSNEHPWFVESKSSKHNPKRDYYLWRDGRSPGGREPPNNWRSMLGRRGWHYDRATEQWYWASFLPFQPDLNYRNPEVKEAMLDVVRHWLSMGVDGLRLDIFNALFKDAAFTNNPFSFRPVPSEDNPDGFFQQTRHTIDHPDTFAFARELRAVVDAVPGPPRFLVGEVFGTPHTLRRYCGEDADGLHLVFLFKSMRAPFSGPGVRAMIAEFEREFPEPFFPTYVFGNHDRPRSILRLGNHAGKAKLLATLQLTARGVPFIYYGEEIGMHHHDIPAVHGLDPIATHFRFVPDWVARRLRRSGILLNRDESRLPMQWHHGPHGGFTHHASSPWLASHPNSAEVNVAAQENDPNSILSCYRQLLALRNRSLALQAGSLELLSPAGVPLAVVAYRRRHGEGERAEVAEVFLNFSSREARVELPALPDRTVFSTLRGPMDPSESRITLQAFEGVVVCQG